MLTGRRYLLAFTPEQEEFAEKIGDACRVVWNTALEQRRQYRRRGAFIGYVEQARQMAEAKKDFPWLAEAPSHTLQQTLRDLERACKRKNAPTFRFPDPKQITVERISRRWGRVKLPKLGWTRFRWTRPLGGQLRNATVLKDGGRWYIARFIDRLVRFLNRASQDCRGPNANRRLNTPPTREDGADARTERGSSIRENTAENNNGPRRLAGNVRTVEPVWMDVGCGAR